MTARSDSDVDELPRWDVSHVFPTLDSHQFRTALEQATTDVERVLAVFDAHDIRAIEPRPVSDADGKAADEAIRLFNHANDLARLLRTYVNSTVATNTRDERAQALLAELEPISARLDPLLARLADWVHALHTGSDGPEALAAVSNEAAQHVGPLLRLAARSAHQMSESEEGFTPS